MVNYKRTARRKSDDIGAKIDSVLSRMEELDPISKEYEIELNKLAELIEQEKEILKQ